MKDEIKKIFQKIDEQVNPVLEMAKKDNRGSMDENVLKNILPALFERFLQYMSKNQSAPNRLLLSDSMRNTIIFCLASIGVDNYRQAVTIADMIPGIQTFHSTTGYIEAFAANDGEAHASLVGSKLSFEIVIGNGLSHYTCHVQAFSIDDARMAREKDKNGIIYYKAEYK